MVCLLTSRKMQTKVCSAFSAENILPPLLHAHLPCGQTALHVSQAQAVTLKHKASSTALRGGLALALRSVTAAKQDSKYFDASRDPSVRLESAPLLADSHRCNAGNKCCWF